MPRITRKSPTFTQVVVALCFACVFGLIVGVAAYLIGLDWVAFIFGFGMFLASLDLMLNGSDR